ncbi:hypothetical protein [Alteromonas sp. 14N.309.X.WAT.G.H12]|uniref:hypothetical protein n=1 Tax=Alteromonas sp. 14N.309.X.WAT.G.H12 TaxID=3120824 RepID=UPI002FD7374B
MRPKIIISTIMLLAAPATAETLKTYTFTSNYIDCVKEHEAEKNEYTQSGLADSGLMNGQSDIPSDSLDGNYWSYMNCLSLADGGTVNETLSTTNACEEIRFSVNGKSYYVPPSADGKEVGLAGRFWVCSNGTWTSADGTIDNPDGTDTTTPENEEKASCGESSSMTYQGCVFNVGEEDLGIGSDGSVRTKNHGTSLTVYYGPDYGDDDATSEGSAVVSCDNGTWSLDVEQMSCQVLSCDIGDEVTWTGYQDGKLRLCDGTVSYGGSVTANAISGDGAATVYPLESLARANTKIMEGSAQFTCGVNGWQLAYSTCEMKASSSLICSATTGGYTCE